MMLDFISLILGFGCGLVVALAVWLSNKSQQGAQLDRFKAISQEALKANSETLMAQLSAVTERAKGDLSLKEQAIATLVNPIHQKLAELDKSQHALNQQLTNLDHETGQLVQALRRPQVRGAWGEVQLKRVAELAGMLAHCDFYEQEAQASGQRPDMVVRLPGGKVIVIDAKTPLEGYLNAMGAEGAAREAALAQHARHVREHIRALSAKSYWSQFEAAPEFVVLFLPGEHFYAAALEADPSLIEAGAKEGVVVATPTTLIALLRAVLYGWRQEKLSETAAEISGIGKELFERVNVFTEHFAKVGSAMESANKAYNSALASLESRVLVSARKLKEKHAVSADAALMEPKAIESRPNVSKVEVVD